MEYAQLAERDAEQVVYSWRLPTYYAGSDAGYDYFVLGGEWYRVASRPGVLEPRMPLTRDREAWVQVAFTKDKLPEPARFARWRWGEAEARAHAEADPDAIRYEPIDWWDVQPLTDHATDD